MAKPGLFRTSTSKREDTAFSDNMRGINNASDGIPLALGDDDHGMTFFSRPLLNLTYDNIKSSRKMMRLLDPVAGSQMGAVRAILDHEQHGGSSADILIEQLRKRGMSSSDLAELKEEEPHLFGADAVNIVNNKLAFIPMLTNTLESISGWKDYNVDTYVSDEGVGKEQYMLADGYTNDYGAFDVTANFRRVRGNFVMNLMDTWLEYQNRVLENTMHMKWYMYDMNLVDYQTRIIRFKFSPDRRFITAWCCASVAQPTAINSGAMFDYDRTKQYDMGGQISVPFKCLGMSTNDPIILEEFNQLVEMFDEGMITRKTKTKLLPEETLAFQYEATPYVGIDEGNELQWWVDTEAYNAWIAQGRGVTPFEVEFVKATEQ